MNDNHAGLCPSPQWAQYLQTDILPVLTRDAGLGAEMLEIGPGPGAATSWLAPRVGKLTAVEIDPAAASRLTARYEGSNVEVVTGSATELGYPAASFDSAGCFTMLHHVPTAALQNAILAEVFRVLRPGGVLIGSDSMPSDDLHRFHEGDTYNPVEPAALLTRLQTIGFTPVTVTAGHAVLFIAGKPGAAHGTREQGAPDGDDPAGDR